MDRKEVVPDCFVFIQVVLVLGYGFAFVLALLDVVEVVQAWREARCEAIVLLWTSAHASSGHASSFICNTVALRICCFLCGYQSCDITGDFVLSDCDVHCLGNCVAIEFVSNCTVHKWTCVLGSGLRRCVQSQLRCPRCFTWANSWKSSVAVVSWALSAVAWDVASSHRCEVPGELCGHVLDFASESMFEWIRSPGVSEDERWEIVAMCTRLTQWLSYFTEL